MLPDADAKVTPEVLQTIAAMETGEKLSAMLDLMARQIPEGVIYPVKVTATITGVRVVLIFGATIYNDGHDEGDGTYTDRDIYILDSDRNIGAQDVPLKKGESVAVDFRYRGQYPHWIKTLASTASVRVQAYR
jgi:hypothetical protein